MILDQIKEVVVKKFKVAPEKVNEGTRLREDLNIDSLDSVSLIMELEDMFNIKIQDDEALGLKTIGDIVTFITARKK
jgi:acyl carrier protein